MTAGELAAPLEPGTRLLHIGPHKTGTTTVQSAFHHSRDSLTRQGVHYAGSQKHSMSAAMAAAGLADLPTQGPSAGPGRWEKLVDEVRGNDSRLTVISSEFYCDADDAHIRSILDALDPARTHVVVTLRPLTRILASQWQQFMQNRISISFEDWLDRMLNDPDQTKVTPSFWRRHRHDRVIARWAEAVGVENLTVVVVDESDKTMLMSAFEDLTGVERGTLVPDDVGANRSLTLAEVELLRDFNQRYVDRDLPMGDYTRFVRFGAARHLQERRPGPDEDRLLTPSWAVDRGLEFGREMIANIESLGVRVIGDLDSLADPALAPPTGDNPAPRVSVEVAARFVTGLVRHLDAVPAKAPPQGRVVGPIEDEIRRLRRAGAGSPTGRAPEVGELTTRELLRVVGGGVRGRLARLVSPARSGA